LDAELSRSLVQQEQQVNGYDRVIGTDSIPHSAFRIPGLAMGGVACGAATWGKTPTHLAADHMRK
jgi:hypothetical protein